MSTPDLDHEALVSVLKSTTDALYGLLGADDDDDQEEAEGFTLTTREAAILTNIWLYRGKTDDPHKIRAELGAHFGVTKERIRQIESRLRGRIAAYNARNGCVTSRESRGLE